MYASSTLIIVGVTACFGWKSLLTSRMLALQVYTYCSYFGLA